MLCRRPSVLVLDVSYKDDSILKADGVHFLDMVHVKTGKSFVPVEASLYRGSHAAAGLMIVIADAFVS